MPRGASTMTPDDERSDPARPDEPPGTADAGDDRPPRRWVRVMLLVVCLGFAAFWIWALFFASKESVNRIEDHAWAERAEAVCADTQTAREQLMDLTRTATDDPEALNRRAELVDEATAGLDAMVDEIDTSAPNDAKGQEIVPQWIEDYRTYLDDRRTYTDELRDGNNPDFRETALEGGIPISAKIDRFAIDNHMDSCQVPTDVALMRG